MTDDRWEALTDEQRAFLLKLGRAPWRWFVSDRRYTATWARIERDNRWATKAQTDAKQRAYWAAVTARTTTYTGPDYRICLDGHWIRATELQYNWAEDAGVQRWIGIPEAVR